MSTKGLLLAGLVLNVLLWSQSRYSTGTGSVGQRRLGVAGLLAKRWIPPASSTSSDEPGAHPFEKHCKPLSFPIDQQCSHVWKSCPESDTFLSISYLQGYFCTQYPARYAGFAALFLWLVFLFSFIGITASDFFCPNLSTIARLFGLSDNIAGVTFLAFGNGSPDLFSTYSAMRANSGSLAVGELLGAATFIVSVVVGSMAITKPFRVRKGAFLRDVGFFTLAVATLLFSLYDGKIEAWEAAVMVSLYVVYVFVVVVGSWWSARRRRQREREDLGRSEYADDVDDDAASSYAPTPSSYHDDPIESGTLDDSASVSHAHSSLSARLPLPTIDARLRSNSQPSRPHLSPITSSIRRLSSSQVYHSRSRSSSYTPYGEVSQSQPELRRNHNPALPSFSLIGAIEFRDVVNSLQKESSEEVLSLFEGSVTTPHSAGRHLRRRLHSQASRGSIGLGSVRSPSRRYDDETDPWDAALAQAAVRSAERSPPRTPDVTSPTLSGDGHHPTLSVVTEGREQTLASIPSIAVLPPGSNEPQSPMSDSPDRITPGDLFNRTSLGDGAVSAPASLPRHRPPPIMTKPKNRTAVLQVLRDIFHVLFPTLQNIRSPDKSWLGRIASLVAAPAVLLLTLSLPVVILPDEDEDETSPPYVPEANLIDAHVEGTMSVPVNVALESPMRGRRPLLHEYVDATDTDTLEARALDAESDVSSIMSDLEKGLHGVVFHRWLLALQCVLGPSFVAAVLFSHSERRLVFSLVALVGGLSAAALVVVFVKDGNSITGRITRSLMGFAVAMVWIMAIADEVVRVLQTFGFIFGLSDAIVGLTIFAIGNSLADFVANLAVAKFAPIMGFSACFGGPMLNMLLGIGISGSVVLRTTGRAYYPIDFSSTLLVSSIGLLCLLLATLVFVPWNGFLLTRRWGIALVIAYTIIMIITVTVEVRQEL